MLILKKDCGEIVLDKVPVRELVRRFPGIEVTCVVRGGAILNEATMADVAFVGLDSLCPVVSTGGRIPGFLPETGTLEFRELYRESPALLLSSFLLALLLALGHLTLLMGLVGYLILTLKGSPETPRVPAEKEKGGLLMALAGFAGGILLLSFGAERLVDSAILLARGLGVGERVIGLTVVALQTSLPELSSCMVEAFCGESGFIRGNPLGSNIFNVLAIRGVTSQMGTMELSWSLFGRDVAGLIGISRFWGSSPAPVSGWPGERDSVFSPVTAVFSVLLGS